MQRSLPRIADLDDETFDPFIEDRLFRGDVADPYPRIAEVRRLAPVHEFAYPTIFGLAQPNEMAGVPTYSVFGYDEVNHVLTSPELFLNKVFERNVGVMFGRSITTMDGREHQRYRRIFQKAFLPQKVARWSDTLVDPVVNELLDRLIERGRGDLIADFTLVYPFRIIYRMLGLPQEDITIFHKLAVTQTVSLERAPEAGAKLGAYFKAMVEARRSAPGDDLVSTLATVEVDGERLPDEVILSFLRQLVNAGGDTTYRGTSVLLTALLRNPEQLEAVRQDRGLIPQAIDEALRWDGPVLRTHRMTAAPVTLGGVALPAGAIVDVIQGSANRDETRFLDPDRFDLWRDRRNRHFAFASGPHVCLGNHLARLEMTRALTKILDLMPDLRLDPDMPPPVISGHHMRAPDNIYVHVA